MSAPGKNRGKVKRQARAAAKAARVGDPTDRATREWMRELGRLNGAHLATRPR